MDAQTTLFTPVDMARMFVNKDEPTTMRQVYVSAVDYTNKVATIMFGGVGGTAVTGIPWLQSYFPAVGDTAWVAKIGSSVLLLGSSNGLQRVTYTPQLLASTTNPTLGSGSTTYGTYQVVDNRVKGDVTFIFGSSGTNRGVGFYEITLPVAAATAGVNINCGHGFYYDADVGVYYVAGLYNAGGTTAILIYANGLTTATAPFTWANGANTQDQINITLDYPV